jgi:hypothetical protein
MPGRTGRWADAHSRRRGCLETTTSPCKAARVSEAQDVCVTFVRAWSESVLRQIERILDAKEDARRLNRQLDREWDQDAEKALEVVWRRNWTEEHALVWSMHQLERWVSRLARERGSEPSQEHGVLRDLRNALEHLDEAMLDGGHVAEAGDDPRMNRSLRRLPGGRLMIATSGNLFGTLSLADLEAVAREQHDLMEQESLERKEAMIEAAIDSYIDDVIAARRELR